MPSELTSPFSPTAALDPLQKLAPHDIMKPMSARCFPLLSLFLIVAGCSPSAKPSVCGENFCLPKGTKLISRETPVEDFNLYRVEANGERFLIYEGNHPQRSSGSVVLNVGKDWPAFLEVSGPCVSKKDCAVRSFASTIVIR
jgi:hypothetical protein